MQWAMLIAALREGISSFLIWLVLKSSQFRIDPMKMLWALYVLLTAALASPQMPDRPAPPDLSKLSSAELTACLEGGTGCGTADHLAISNELIGRLPSMPTEKLVACFTDWRICGTGEDQASGWPISDELARRGNPHDLIVRYWTEPSWEIRGGIEHVAYHFDTPEARSFMARVLAERRKDGEDFYWPANYLAKQCDPAGLKELSRGRHRNQGCMQFQTTVELFGKCMYRPAIPYLVEDAIEDACLNVAGAAADDLHALYTGSPENFENLPDAQKYYCSRAKKDGIAVRCDSK
jgi:hypothetical protein